MSRPELSIVVSTYNRSELLRRLLASLDRQDAAAESFEVVVVVDGSTDGTAGMLASLTPRYALAVLDRTWSGPSAARDAGAARAAGRVVLFLDDDEDADPGLVSAHLEAHRSHERIVVIGAIERRVPGSADRFARLQAADANANARIGQAAGRPATYADCFAGNMSVARTAFDEAGGFAADLAQLSDLELAYRLHALGLDFVRARRAVVTEYRTRPWRTILAEAEARGRVAVELYRRHPPTISSLRLGGAGGRSASPAGVALTRSMLVLRVSPVAVAAVGLALPGEAWARAWFSVALNLAHWRGVRTAASPELWRRSRHGTLVLGYHAFGADGEPPSRYVVPASRFVRQLGWLARRGYNVISLGEYVEHRSSHRLPPPKSVVVTVDDGYLDAATIARPILERFGFRATMFLISSADGKGVERTDPALVGRGLIPPASARELLGGAFEIGAHTVTHPDLTRIPLAEAEAEIAGSKLELERLLAEPVTTFAYPYGAADPAVRALVEQAGFLAARGILPGPNRPAGDPFDLRRTEVRGTDSLLRFAATLVLGDVRRLGPGSLRSGRRRVLRRLRRRA